MKLMVGVDEVGRGPWAGPLVAAAVIWDADVKLKGLKDSKCLSRLARSLLARKIKQLAQQIGIGWASAAEIDKHGLTWANRQAMLRALDCLEISLTQLDIIVDGKVDYLKDEYACKVMVGADKKVPAVSAASIIAKVARDSYMLQMDRLFPKYEFGKHVGYGTKLHSERLLEYGPSLLHRQSFAPIAKLTA